MSENLETNSLETFADSMVKAGYSRQEHDQANSQWWLMDLTSNTLHVVAEKAGYGFHKVEIFTTASDNFHHRDGQVVIHLLTKDLKYAEALALVSTEDS